MTPAGRFAPAFALSLVLVVTLLVAAYRLHHDALVWTSDSAVYLRMALADRGLSRDESLATADRFMATTPEGTRPESRALYGPTPPAWYVSQFDLFRTRPLYPALSALLYGRLGPRGMQLLSAAAYVAASLALCALLLRLTGAWFAALGALAFATAPQVLDLSALALTDELAVLFWIGTLAAMFSFVRSPGPIPLACVLVAALLLTFTRPAAYLPFGAAAGFAIAVRGAAARRADAYRLLGVTALAGLAFAAYTFAAHGTGLAEQLRWQYHWQHVVGGPFAERPFLIWYGLAVASAVALLLTVAVYRYAALLPLALAGIGLRFAGRETAGLALGAAGGALAAVLANPLELNRTVLLPLTPVVVILATLGIARLTPPERRLPARSTGYTDPVS